jgi:hypothetical protein
MTRIQGLQIDFLNALPVFALSCSLCGREDGHRSLTYTNPNPKLPQQFREMAVVVGHQVLVPDATPVTSLSSPCRPTPLSRNSRQPKAPQLEKCVIGGCQWRTSCRCQESRPTPCIFLEILGPSSHAFPLAVPALDQCNDAWQWLRQDARAVTADEQDAIQRKVRPQNRVKGLALTCLVTLPP